MEIMTTDEKSRGLGIDGNEPAGKRQRLPWHAPQLIKSTTVQRLTGTHMLSTGAEAITSKSGVS
jgi:hypothetical protein